MVLSDLALPRVLSRRHGEAPFEPVRQVALIGEPGRQCHVRQRHPAGEEALRLPDAHTFEVGMWRHADLRPEDPRDIMGAEADQFREARQ